MKTLTASAFVVLEPIFDRRNNVSGFKLAKLTQGRPTTAEASGIVVRLDVEAPPSAFDPVRAQLRVPKGSPAIVVRMDPAPPEPGE